MVWVPTENSSGSFGMDVLADFLAHYGAGALFEDPGPVESPIYLGLLVGFGVCTLVGLVLALQPSLLSGGNQLHERIMREYGGWLGWIGGFGLVAVGFRYTSAPFFAKRLWI